MSIAALGWGIAQTTGSGPRKAVLLALCNYADENGQSWPSIGRMCRDTEFSERTVRDALRDLEEAGLVTREERRTEDGAMRSNLYRIHVPARMQEPHPRGHLSPPRGGEPQGDPGTVAGGMGREPPPEPSLRTSTLTKEAPNGAHIEDLKERSSHPKPAVWGSFEEFWMAYPAKVGKEAAKKKFSAVGKSGRVKFTDLMTALETYKARKPHDRPWCYPTTWLNQGRWDDEHGASADERRRNYASV